VAIEESIKRALSDLDLDRHMLDYLFKKILANIRDDFGGTKVYIAGRRKIDPDQVKAFFNGRNIDATMEHFKISKSRVYQIINDV
jgi:Mor family transcriptional regulator